MSPEQLVQRKCSRDQFSQTPFLVNRSKRTSDILLHKTLIACFPTVVTIAYGEMVAISRKKLVSDKDIPGAMIALVTGRHIYFASSIKTGLGSSLDPVEKYHDNIMVEYFNNCRQQGSGRRK